MIVGAERKTMEYFVEKGLSHTEVMQTIYRKYGDKAKVMHHRDVRIPGFLGIFSREGVEVTGYLTKEPIRRPRMDFDEEKRRLLAAAGERTSSRQASNEPAVDPQALQTILTEVQSIKQQLGSNAPAAALHPGVQRIKDLLMENDFNPGYIEMILERVNRTFSMEDLKDEDAIEEQVLTWIGESVEVYPPQKVQRPEIFILVGPTGVGKTTTIAKLAAMYGLGRTDQRKASVRILTIDNYRIGARQQMETYGDIMGIPVDSIESKEEMRKHISMYQDADIIFVDTIGKSPRDFERLGKMRALLDACGTRSSVHLGISATIKTSDMQEVLRQFEPFGYKSVVLTKLDETTKIGNIISVLHESRKQLSFVTYGQKVPQDIERASIPFLLKHISGFQGDRGKVYEHFADNADTTFEGEIHG